MEVHESLFFFFDPTIIEALALRETLQWLQMLGVDQIDMETDSQIITQ